jgi:hypothetical protein
MFPKRHPDYYRGITLVSSVGKVFTLILNSRLTKYADLVDKIPNAQAGFRKGYSTTDNMFCLHVLIDIRRDQCDSSIIIWITRISLVFVDRHDYAYCQYLWDDYAYCPYLWDDYTYCLYLWYDSCNQFLIVD